MLKQRRVKWLLLSCLAAGMTWLGGCGGLPGYGPAETPPLTVDQLGRVGTAVSEKLTQILGGPYHDQQVAADLNRLASGLTPQPPVITVADRSAVELYAVLGQRVVMTRGLLADLDSSAQLAALLRLAGQLADDDNRVPAGKTGAEAVEQVLAGTDSVYDPNAAAIRLARQYATRPCRDACLAPVFGGGVAAGSPGRQPLPASVRRLADLRPGFELLARARSDERQGTQSKALAAYLQAAATTVDEPHILAALGMAYLRADQLQPARLHLQQAVALQPDYYRTLMGLGYLSLQEGEYARANELLARSIRLLAVAENLYLLAETREKSGDSRDAMALYRLVIEADRDGKLGQSAAARLARSGGGQ